MIKMLFLQIKHITYATFFFFTLSGDICDHSAFFILTQEGREETKQKKKEREKREQQ